MWRMHICIIFCSCKLGGAGLVGLDSWTALFKVFSLFEPSSLKFLSKNIYESTMVHPAGFYYNVTNMHAEKLNPPVEKIHIFTY